MAARRLGIGLKLTGIYLIIAIPLLIAVGLSFVARYREHLETATQERRDVARVTAEGFASELDSMALNMRFVMRHAVDERRSAEEIASELSVLDDDFPIAYSAMLDPQGRVMGATEDSLIGADLSQRPEVRPLLEANRPLASSDVTVGLDGQRGFYVAAALTTQPGEVRAAITAFVPLELLQTRAPILLRTGFAHIVDSQGQLVYSSRDPRYVALGTDWSQVPFVRAALRGRSVDGWYRHPVTGESVLVAEQPIPTYGWTAGSAIPADEVLSVQREQLLVLATLLLAVQIVVLAVVAYLSRRLVGPLLTLIEDSQAVGEGRFDNEIHADTGDEIESLAESLDQTRRKLKRYVEGLSALSQNGRALAVNMQHEALDRTIIAGATELFGASEVWILLERDGAFVPRLLHGTDLDTALLGQSSSETGMLADVLRGGATRVIADMADLPPSEWAQRAHARDIHSVAILPLTSRMGSQGILGIAAPQVMPWAEERRERELLELFAGQVSDALESARLFEQIQRLADDNERLYQRERDVALRLQESLLRIPSSIPGVRFSHLYRSAIRATLVGGDFYDLFELGEQRLGIAVGDVSGKGLEAATLISFVKSALRAYAYEEHSPAVVLASINDAVGRLSEPAEFVTVFFGVFDCSTGSLTYCSAGHPPALILRAPHGGQPRVDELPSGSPLLGAFAGVTFENGEERLLPGDTMLLYTDGVTEARDADGVLFGTERLLATLLDAPREIDLTRFVYDRIVEYTQSRLADDIAMLAFTPEDQSCETPQHAPSAAASPPAPQ